jgi:hypothetical protein
MLWSNQRDILLILSYIIYQDALINFLSRMINKTALKKNNISNYILWYYELFTVFIFLLFFSYNIVCITTYCAIYNKDERKKGSNIYLDIT